MKGWEEKRLNDFVWFQRGFDLPKDKFNKGFIPVYGSTSLLGYHNEAKVKAPGIVTGRSGTLGIFQYINEDFWPHNTTLWVKDFKGNDPRFTFYLLQCLDFSLFNSGGAVPTLNRNVLNAFVVKIPPLLTQRLIASILSAYDDLIENNLRRINLLEELAQRTYEEWFVKFKINGQKQPLNEETGLPEVWEKTYFENKLNFKTGKIDSNALVENGKYDFYTCAKEVLKTNSYCFQGEAVLLGGNNATGDFSLFYANSKFNVYQRTYIVTSCDDKIPLVYVFLFMKKLLPFFQIVSSGTSTKFLTMKILNKMKLLLPSYDDLNHFQKLVRPCFDSILMFQNQNRLLKESRDILLPRLMGGVINVDNKN